jgi:hypothetical protein
MLVIVSAGMLAVDWRRMRRKADPEGRAKIEGS